ncbi:MAG: transporter [Methylophilaceae bacterium 17-44-8]|nr:MAG: transporter [Methylophilaceae bacterium 17-44-8]
MTFNAPLTLHLTKPIATLIAIIVCTHSFAEETTTLQGRMTKRLATDEQLKLDDYATQPPTSLKQAVDGYQERQKKTDPKAIVIDLQKALKSYEDPAAEKGIVPGDNVSASQQVSIEDIRMQALSNNLAIQVAKIDPLIAAASTREEEAKFDNIVFAYAKYGRYDTPKVSGDKVEFTSDNPALNNELVKLSTIEQEKRSLGLEAGIKIPLRTGGTVTLSSPLEGKESIGKFATEEYRSALRFSFSQPLLRDAGKQVNEASIRIATFEQQSTNINTRLQAIRIIAMVDKAYWSLYEAWGELDVRKQQYEYAQQNLAMVKRRVEEGLTAAVEVNRAQIGVADRMEALIVAETNLKLAQRQLRFFLNDIGDSPDANVLVPVSQPNLLKYDFDRQKLLNDAMAGRLELLAQEIKLAADMTNIEYLENQTLPMFTLDYQYGALSNTADNIGNSYQNVWSQQFNDWSIGLKFEMPFTNEARKARLERAVQQRNQRLATRGLQQLTVKKEIYDALDQVDQHWQRILAARQQVLIAGVNYDAELKQFNEGLRTMTEVLETLTRLGEAQIKEVRAISDYQISLVDTAYATGTLLGYSKLNFQ